MYTNKDTGQHLEHSHAFPNGADGMSLRAFFTGQILQGLHSRVGEIDCSLLHAKAAYAVKMAQITVDELNKSWNTK